ncbi:MAG: murein biosynthesis integral membrane protein MurJ [Actinomycetes bacterium]
MADVTDGDATGSRRNSALVAAGILLSRLSGLVRERAVGYFLGRSFAADAFVAAFRIPNLLQNLLGEGVLSASFIPVYSRLLHEGRDEEAARTAGAVLGLLSATAGAVALLAVLAAGPVIGLLTPGIEPATRELAVTLLRLIAPGIALLVVSAWCLGVLNSHRRFFLSYAAPVVWNLAQIVALVAAGVLLLDDLGAPEAAGADVLAGIARALAVGTLVGGLLQVLVQLPTVRGLAGGLRPSLRRDLPGVRDTLRAFGPVVAGRGVVQLLTFVDLVLASLLATGALTALQKAQILALLPISLFGMSVAAAELPELSTAGPDDRARLGRRLDAGLERIAFFVLPTVVAFVVLGDHVVGALFQTGAFDRRDTQVVWLVLAGATVGLVATTSSRLLQSALYGTGDTRGPATLAVVRVVLAGALGALLMLQLDRVVLTDTGIGLGLAPGATLPAFTPLPADVRASTTLAHLGAAGLTLASGATAWVEFRLLRELVLLRLGHDVRAGGAARGRLLASAGVAAVVALASRVLVAGLHPVPAAVVAVGLTGGVYVAVAAFLGVTEARVLLDQVHRRVTRGRPAG